MIGDDVDDDENDDDDDDMMLLMMMMMMMIHINHHFTSMTITIVYHNFSHIVPSLRANQRLNAARDHL